jgi:hypothetical protein
MLNRDDLKVKKVKVIQIEEVGSFNREHYMKEKFPYKKREPNTLYVVHAVDFSPDSPPRPIPPFIAYKWPSEYYEVIDGKNIRDGWEIDLGTLQERRLDKFFLGTYCLDSANNRNNRDKDGKRLSEEDATFLTENLIIPLFKKIYNKSQAQAARPADKKRQQKPQEEPPERKKENQENSPQKKENNNSICLSGTPKLEMAQEPARRQEPNGRQKPDEPQEPEEYEYKSSSFSWKRNSGIVASAMCAGGLFSHSLGISGAVVAGLTIPGWAIGMLAGGLAACVLMAVYYSCCHYFSPPTHNPAEAIAQRRGYS